MVCEVLLVNRLYHIFQCIMFEKNSSNCNSQICFSKVSYWSIRHFWENYIDIPKVSYWSIRHFWETNHIVQSDTFRKYIHQKGIFSYICTHYWNVNAMTLKLLHWKIRTFSLELKNNPKPGLRPHVGLVFNSRESVRIFQCNNFKVIALSQYTPRDNCYAHLENGHLQMGHFETPHFQCSELQSLD